MKKKIALFLCMLMTLLPFTMISASAEYNADNDMQYIQIAQSWAQAYMTFPVEQLEEYKAMGAIAPEQVTILETWIAVAETVGTNPMMGESTVQLAGEDVKVIVPVTGDAGSAYFVANFDSTVMIEELIQTGQLKSAQFTTTLEEDSGSLGAKMKKAVLNTAMGMGTVFLILIFISLVIYTLKFVPEVLDKVSRKKNKAVEAASSTTSVQSSGTAEKQDDAALVAVIAAAAAAAMTEETGTAVTADQLIVRSIKRANKR